MFECGYTEPKAAHYPWRQAGRQNLADEGVWQFGRIAFDKIIYISFDNNRRMEDLFSFDPDVERYSGPKTNPTNTLLIFDEVQEVPKALTSLTYFNENAPQYQIVCAGSLPDVALPSRSFYAQWATVHMWELLQQGDFDMAAVSNKPKSTCSNTIAMWAVCRRVVHRFSENEDFGEARKNTAEHS